MSKDFFGIAYQYCLDVVDGVIPACKYVKQACQRQLDDLVNDDLPYFFSVERAEHVCYFIELLEHIKGEWRGNNIELEPAQIFILTTVFGWVDEQGYRRFKTAYIEWPRKNAKSTLSSGVALYCQFADGEGAPEVYSAATTRDQARIVFKDAAEMVKQSKGLQRKYGATVSGKTIFNSIFSIKNGSVFKPLSRDQGGNLDGLNVHCGVIDELHAHKTRDVFDVIETATGARRQPLLWLITTAGFNRAGICYEQRDYVTRILKGSANDDEYFGVIYTIDGPYKDIVQSSRLITMIGDDCECQTVTNTQKLELLLEECVSLVTTHGTKKTKRNMLQNVSIQIEEFVQEVYAVLVMNNSCLIETLKEKIDQLERGRNGQEKTQTKERQQCRNGSQSQRIDTNGYRAKGNQNTELVTKSLKESTANKMELALFAEILKSENQYALITAMKQVMLEVYYVEDAIQELGFSKIVKILLNQHIDTCQLQKKITIKDNDKYEYSFSGDDWTDPISWQKANPLWGVSVNPQDIERKARKAMELPSATNNFLTKHLNVWVNADVAWMDMRKWEALADPNLNVNDYIEDDACLGVDLASKIDIAAKILLFKRIIDGEEHYYLFGTYWLPEETVMNGQNSQYSGWVRAGHIQETEGAIINYDEIETDIIENCTTYNVRECAYDPFQATQMSGHLVEQGITMVEVRPTYLSFSEPMKEFEALVMDGRIHHNGCPVFTWMLSNVVAHRDNKDNIYPRKEFEQNKIDGVVAALMALNRLMFGEEEIVHDSIYNYGSH